jgi:tetratricopeptide (TPR) repeat protein
VERGYSVLREFADANPENAAAHLNLANYLVWSGRIDEALIEIDMAESLQPGSAQAEMLRINVDIINEDWPAGSDRARGLVSAASSPLWRFQGMVAQGLIELFQGQSARALDLVRGFAVEYPDLGAFAAQAPLFVASIHFERGDYERALRAGERAAEMLEDQQDPTEALGLIALSQASMGDEDAAGATIDSLLAVTQEMPQRMVRRGEQVFRGRYALAVGDYVLAIEELRRAARMLPPRPSLEGNPHLRVWYSLGVAYFESGEEEDALEWFQRAIESRPHIFDPFAYVRSHFFLGQIYEELGDDEQAAHYYRRFLDFWGEGDMDAERVEEARGFLED